MIDHNQLIGQYLGKFKIDSYVREEPYAQIYRGHHESLERKVVIKILQPSDSGNYFLSHCQPLLSLEHETIASIYDVTFDNERQQYYIVEQAVEGQTLAHIIECQHIFTIQDALKIILEVSQAINFAHAHGVIHGHLTPHDLIKTAQQSWKIINFGLIPTYQEDNKIIFGVPNYIAPEQLDGSLPTVASDIYQLGTIFYELLIGHTPIFEEATTHRVEPDKLEDIPEETLPSEPSTPPKVKESQRITRRMLLHHDSTRRFITTKQLDLDEVSATKHRASVKFDTSVIISNVPRINFPSSIPDQIIDCLSAMLAYEPSQRFSSVSELVLALEELWLTFNQVICPRCGRQNSVSEVFHCSKCNTNNLCLKHIVPEVQCCDRCATTVATKTTRTRRFVAMSDNWRKLIDLLRNIANNNRSGLLVLGIKGSEIGLNITPDLLELYSSLPSIENLIGIPNTEETSKAVFYHYLLYFMQNMECTFDFWENDSPDKILPNVELRARLLTSSGGFLITFSQILRLFRDISTYGGLYFITPNHTIGIAMTEHGATFYTMATDHNWEIYNRPDMVDILLSVFTGETPSQVEYRIHHNLMNQTAHTIPFSVSDFAQILRQAQSWTILSGLVPEMHAILPPTVRWDRPFNGIDLNAMSSHILQNLFLILHPPTIQEMTGFDSTKTFIFISMMLKERITEISQYLIEVVKTHAELNFTYAETILIQARKLCPESLDIYYALATLYENHQELVKAAECYSMTGGFHLATKDIGLALPDYEKAISLDPKPIEPRWRLIELYEQLEQREKLRKVGLDLFITLQQRPQDESKLEQLCQKLLKADNGLVPCHQAMIQIATHRKDSAMAIRHYDMLIPLYHRANNRQAMIKAMSNLVKLEGSHTNIKRKLHDLGYDWKEILQSPSLIYKKRLLRYGSVCLIILLLIGSIFYREHQAKKQLQLLKDQTITLTNVQEIKSQLWTLAGTRYFSSVTTQALMLLEKVYAEENILLDQKHQIEEKKLFSDFLQAQQFCQEIEQWQEVCNFDNLALLFFVNPEYRQKIHDSKEQHDKKLQIWTAEINKKAQMSILRAREYEKKGEYATAVDIYYKILQDKYLSKTPATKNITIPLVLDIPNDALLECSDTTRKINIVRGSKIYRYPPNKVPQIEGKHPKKTVYISPEYTKNGQIWKISAMLK